MFHWYSFSRITLLMRFLTIIRTPAGARRAEWGVGNRIPSSFILNGEVLSLVQEYGKSENTKKLSVNGK